jgi:hypothetical protein
MNDTHLNGKEDDHLPLKAEGNRINTKYNKTRARVCMERNPGMNHYFK